MLRLQDEHGNSLALGEIGAIRGHYDPTGRTSIESDNYYINGDLDDRFTDYFDVGEGITEEVANYPGDLWVSLDGPCEREDGADEIIWIWAAVVDVPVEAMTEVMTAHRELACGDEDPAEVAEQWIDRRFTPEEAETWISTARCFRPGSAFVLRRYEVSPEDAATIHEEGYRDTVGYKFANQDMDADASLEAMYGTPPWNGYESKTYTEKALWKAFREGEGIWKLDMGSGDHDVLIGNEEKVTADVLTDRALDALPDDWTLVWLGV